MVGRDIPPRREFSAEGPQLRMVSAERAAELLGSISPTAIKRLITREELSFASERERYGVAPGRVSWWELVRLGAYERLRERTGQREQVLRLGLTVLEFDLRPFVVARYRRARPIVLDADQVDTFAQGDWARFYDPSALMRRLGLFWGTSDEAPTPEITRTEIAAPKASVDLPFQEVLDPSFRDPTLFDD